MEIWEELLADSTRDKEKKDEPKKKPVIPQVVEPPGEVSPRKLAYEEIERGSTFFELLTETEQAAYAGWFDVMVNGESKMSEEEAHKKASELLAKSSRILQARENLKMYQATGTLKIYSTILDKHIFLAKDSRAKRLLEEQWKSREIPASDIYLESEIQELAGLRGEELTLMLEAREIFKGVIVDPKNKG